MFTNFKKWFYGSSSRANQERNFYKKTSFTYKPILPILPFSLLTNFYETWCILYLNDTLLQKVASMIESQILLGAFHGALEALT